MSVSKYIRSVAAAAALAMAPGIAFGHHANILPETIPAGEI